MEAKLVADRHTATCVGELEKAFNPFAVAI